MRYRRDVRRGYGSKASAGTCSSMACLITLTAWSSSRKVCSVLFSHAIIKCLSTNETLTVPLNMFMEYVPDYIAFKKLAFKGADSYICKVCQCPFSSPLRVEPQVLRTHHEHFHTTLGQTEEDKAILHPSIRATQGSFKARGKHITNV